ncbi:MAG: TatD family hydrolase [Nitrososphaerota archaeon]|nr:TatD family hydrolase [Aigarchaeota archaeon]MDW8076299.1 TatD family hydrolase [Nitrososphaerota archaeon]
MLVDAHAHLYGFKDPEKFSGIAIIVVAEDYHTSLEALRLGERFNNVFPCVGVHPWKLSEVSDEEIKNVCRLIGKYDVKCIGEVGLDRRHARTSFDRQLEVFNTFVRLASEYSLPMNLHCLDTWQKVLDILLKNDVTKALFHWYTGPLNLLEKISSAGYFISINPMSAIQKRHKEAARLMDIRSILTESDGAYVYRGVLLEPSMVENSLNVISEVKGMDKEVVKRTVAENFRNFLKI